jgi:hypothetical protein
MEATMADLTGATVTPHPTSFQFSAFVTSGPVEIPVTGTSETPAVQAGVHAIVSSDEGANQRAEPSSDSAFVVALAPQTGIEVLGASRDGQWVYVAASEGVSGWVYIALVTLGSPIESIPIIE